MKTPESGRVSNAKLCDPHDALLLVLMCDKGLANQGSSPGLRCPEFVLELFNAGMID